MRGELDRRFGASRVRREPRGHPWAVYRVDAGPGVEAGEVGLDLYNASNRNIGSIAATTWGATGSGDPVFAFTTTYPADGGGGDEEGGMSVFVVNDHPNQLSVWVGVALRVEPDPERTTPSAEEKVNVP